MRKILVVDDNTPNREAVLTLLEDEGYEAIEAADGAEGLRLAEREQPHLVISDILMPSMDGYEFVRQLRGIPKLAQTSVIFYTANYHRREAKSLAEQCGVARVIIKPCGAREFLNAVTEVLSGGSGDAAPQIHAEFDRNHLQLLTDKLSQQADELRRANERLTALVDLGLELGSDRDPAQVLQSFCHAAREIIGAKYAIAGILDADRLRLRYFFTSGMDAVTATRLGTPDPREGMRPRMYLKAFVSGPTAILFWPLS